MLNPAASQGPPPAAAQQRLPPLTAAALLEAPVPVAREWLAAQPEDTGRLVLFNKPDVLQAFGLMVNYVARLQRALQRTGEPTHGQLIEAKAMNMLLLGVKGVGKTALVRGVVAFTNAVAAADPTFGVVGIYVDCSDDGEPPLPVEAMLTALEARLGGDAKAALGAQPWPEDVVREAHEQGVSFFIAYDELQRVYQRKLREADGVTETPQTKRAHRRIAELYHLGKNCSNVATVLTGSSKRTEHYVYRDHGHDGILKTMCDEYAAAAEGYPDLNNTVFEAMRIFPLRDKSQIAAVFPEEDDASLARRFFWSGGAGRQLRVGTAMAATALPGDPPQRDAVLHLLWLNELLTLDAATGDVAVNEARAAELQANPWSLRWEDTKVVEHLLGATSSGEPGMRARGLLGLMEDASLLYTDANLLSSTFFRPCDAVVWARLAAHLLGAKPDAVTRLCHMLLASKCDGSGSLGHRVEPDMLRFAAGEGGLNPSAGLQWAPTKLQRIGDAWYLGDVRVNRLEDVPVGVVLGIVGERGKDGFWLSARDAAGVVKVHLVQVKAGGRDEHLICGQDGEVAGDTLATIAWRMLRRGWPDVRDALALAAGVTGCTLALGTITLLTTKHVKPANMERFTALSSAEAWFVVDGQRRNMRIVNDLDLVVRPESRGFYL